LIPSRSEHENVLLTASTLKDMASETATAEAEYYSHTLTYLDKRRGPTPVDRPDPRLASVTAELLSLPAEIRATIYDLVFDQNRVTVTAREGCFCGSSAAYEHGYGSEHVWLLRHPALYADAKSLELRRDVLGAFVSRARWEVHCAEAWKLFTIKMSACGMLNSVHHVQVNVFEPSVDTWTLPTEKFQQLRTITFSPWQKGWTIDVPAQEGHKDMSDESLMLRVRHAISTKPGYEYLRMMMEQGVQRRGGWKCFFLFPIRFHFKWTKTGRPRWQLRVSSSDDLPHFRQLTLTTFRGRSGKRISMKG
jgi:hypothetical protein